jgi:hypothetical protein
MKARAIHVWVAWFFVLLIAAAAAAQMAGSRDLTSGSPAPRERVPGPRPEDCDHINSSMASDAASGAKAPGTGVDGLQLDILRVAPVELQIGREFVATLRLKNGGAKPIAVPWTADGEQVVRVSPDGGEEQYEVADISFRLQSGKQSLAIFLDSEGALFARPQDQQSYLSLQPGAWIEMQVKGSVSCGLENCLVTIQPDDRAVLTAWWYQRVLSHRVAGCEESHGSRTVRQLDSTPFQVVVRAPQAVEPGGLDRAAREP